MGGSSTKAEKLEGDHKFKRFIPLPNHYTKIYNHNEYKAGCSIGCRDPNCEHPPKSPPYDGFERYFVIDEKKIVVYKS